jgi:CubicO group peptidase (beta-lactamase class C family)
MGRLALLLALVLSLVAPIGAAAFQAAKPEEVGLSRDRLARIAPALTRQIEAGSFPGAVALVARKGRIAYFEAVGQLDPKIGAPMSKEQLVAVLMTQAQPGPWQREFKELFRQMVYQAIVD